MKARYGGMVKLLGRSGGESYAPTLFTELLSHPSETPGSAFIDYRWCNLYRKDESWGCTAMHNCMVLAGYPSTRGKGLEDPKPETQLD